MSAGRDPMTQALHFADWWTQLACAEAWRRAAELLEPIDAGAARVAWQRVADGYAAYSTEHAAHLPASRWEHDYGPELTAAKERHRALPDRAPSADLPNWVRSTLARHFTQACEELRSPPEAAHERALVGVLVIGCRAAKRQPELERFEAWKL